MPSRARVRERLARLAQDKSLQAAQVPWRAGTRTGPGRRRRHDAGHHREARDPPHPPRVDEHDATTLRPSRRAGDQPQGAQRDMDGKHIGARGRYEVACAFRTRTRKGCHRRHREPLAPTVVASGRPQQTDHQHVCPRLLDCLRIHVGARSGSLPVGEAEAGADDEDLELGVRHGVRHDRTSKALEPRVTKLSRRPLPRTVVRRHRVWAGLWPLLAQPGRLGRLAWDM